MYLLDSHSSHWETGLEYETLDFRSRSEKQGLVFGMTETVEWAPEIWAMRQDNSE